MDPVVIKMTFSVVGGLGIFLLGMRNMSEGLQATAGPALRRLIGMVTDNRFTAVGVGTAVTCLVQSSSVTTVMVVGFVNSGIMLLKQAMGVILGANIGTTVTGWMLVLEIGKYGLPIVGASAFFYLFGKKERLRYIAMAVMGIGMVFFGLELMKDGFQPVREMPAFKAWFEEFSADTYFGVLKCAFVGCVLTVVVQSSSATLGITIALATTGALSFPTAAALVLGENVGTTITAYLASFGAGANARRAAYFHVIFNLIGVAWITAVFRWYLPLIEHILSWSNIPDVSAAATGADGKPVYPHTKAGIALVHTVFNVANVVVFLPLLGSLSGFLERRVSDKPRREKKYLTNLEFHMFDSPFAALEQSRAELRKMAVSTREMLEDLRSFLVDVESRHARSREIFAREEILDVVQKEITVFLTDALSGQLSHDQTEEAKQQIRIVDELESVSDYVVQVVKLHLRLKDSGQRFSEDQQSEFCDLLDRVEEFFDLVVQTEADPRDLLERAEAASHALNETVRSLRSRHWDRLSHEESTPLVGTTYSDVLHSYRKMKEHLLNVAQVRAGEK